MVSLDRVVIRDVVDVAAFRALPPCADPQFDHRTCDYWEDADRGSKAARPSWLEATGPRAPRAASPAASANPFLADLAERETNPFATPAADDPARNPFLAGGADDADDNPFAPKPAAPATVGDDAPRKLRLLGRGLGVTGSYAKTLFLDDEPAAYCQFGPLTAYPRAQRTRELYPALPDSPLPAVITCIATTPAARRRGLAKTLVLAVVDDLAGRGFSAVEAYPEPESDPDATSAATPAFWVACGFQLAIDDARFPVVRMEL